MSSFKATILDLKGIHLTTPAVTAEAYDSPIRLKVTFEAHGEILHTILSKPLVQQSTTNNNVNDASAAASLKKYKAVFPKSSIVLPAIESVATPVSSCSSEELPGSNSADDGIVFHVKASVIFDQKKKDHDNTNSDEREAEEQYLGSTVLNVDSNVETNSVLMMVLPVRRASPAPVPTTSLDSPVALPRKSKSFVGKWMKRTRSLTAAVRSPTSVMNPNNSANANLNGGKSVTEVSRPNFELLDEAQMRIKFKMVEDALRPRPRSHAEYLAQLRDLSRAAHNESSSGNRGQDDDHFDDNVDGSTNYGNSLVSSKDYESDDDNDTSDHVSRQSCSGPSFLEALSSFMCAPNCGGVDVDVEVGSMLRNVDSYGSTTQDSRFVPAVEDGYWKHYEFDEISLLTDPTVAE
mmetsp:Transcript_6835/g.10030  ORF Transcript_6835/g.10030 Transcript_6835/m.10030 type:complete len:406 (-) Transcript_6835:235-1452(-)|eukprot:CAMPEP_0196819700 /NCGR_PEP_ID=MMETSP1362-20130617/71790_1 /TAXON_ID=163516 /ORGANISM="Leptocylindrus danicus, Strain CCMP1856" /LENGTH=405 /DNA_ID=CAMNT_0042198281 /DNA_START=113 /DNA_END=1330 /DNA_ORIENTATION=-